LRSTVKPSRVNAVVTMESRTAREWSSIDKDCILALGPASTSA
jgi:hypothetical protein